MAGVDGLQRSNGTDALEGMSVDPATTQQLHDTKNHHLQHPDEDQSTHGTSSTDSREATKTVDQEVSERMAADPEAKRIQELLDKSKGLADDWNFLQDNLIGYGDQILDRETIITVSKDPCQSDEMRAAANRLLANREFLNGVNGTDTKASSQEVDAFIKGLEAQLKGIRDAKTAEVKEERGMAASSQAGTAAGAAPNGAPAPAATGSTPAQSVPLPPPSDKPGMEGAMENLGNMGDYYSKQMLAIANDSSIDPGKKSALIADLQTKQQATMNMLNQLIQMMQNTSKLWSEIAMNSVRNIK